MSVNNAPAAEILIKGEFTRALDERYRLAVPASLIQALEPTAKNNVASCILAKERTGCLSLWNAVNWKAKLSQGVELIQRKLQMGKMEGRIDLVQNLGRLLSTRHKELKLDAKGRALIPEGFREFLGVSQGDEVIIVGAAVCIEIWNPKKWIEFLDQQMPEFNQLFDQLVE